MTDFENIRPSVELELDGQGGGWTEINRDVDPYSDIEANRGMLDGSVLSRVATAGVMTFSLLNCTGNSAGLAGYYTPGHANVRAGFAKGIGVRLRVYINSGEWATDWADDWASGQHVTLWTGRLAKVEPEPGAKGILARVVARDYVDQLTRQSISACTVEFGINEGVAVQNVIDAMGIAPRGEVIPDGPDTYDYWGDRIREERSRPAGALQDICTSSHGTAYIDRNGFFVYEPRNQLRAVEGSSLTSDISIVAGDLVDDTPPRVVDNTEDRHNLIRCILTPRDQDAAESVLWRLQAKLVFQTGITTLTGLFSDPDERGFRAGGTSLVTPTTPTDYKFNSLPDGTGSDESANVSVTPTFCGNSVALEINNTSGAPVYPVDGSGNVLLQVRGVAIKSKEQLFFEDEDTDHSDDYGENMLVVPMPYQSDPVVAQALATWYKDKLADEDLRLDKVPLLLYRSDLARALETVQLGISDTFDITDPQSGLDGTQKYFINALGYRFDGDGRSTVTLTPTPADAGPFIPPAAETNVKAVVVGGENNQSKTTFVTKSGRSTANWKQTLWITYGRDDSVTPAVPTSITGAGLTWSLVNSALISNGGTHRQGMAVYEATVLPSSAVGALTITFPATMARCSWAWVETSGSAVVQSAIRQLYSAPTITATLAAFADPANRPMAAVSTIPGTTFTKEAGWTVAAQLTGTSPIMVAWNESTADVSASFTGPSGVKAAIAVEIDRT